MLALKYISQYVKSLSLASTIEKPIKVKIVGDGGSRI
jgi:hypothetical protein